MQCRAPCEKAFISIVSFKIDIFCESCLIFIWKGWNFHSEAKIPKCLMLSKHQISHYSIWHKGFFFPAFHCETAVWKAGFVFQLLGNWTHLLTWNAICWALQSDFVLNFCKNYTCSVSDWRRSKNGRISHEVERLIPLLLWLGSKHHRENFPRRLFITFWIWKRFNVFNLQCAETNRETKYFHGFG